MDQSINSIPSKKSYTTDENRVTYFAETDSRNRRVKFGIKAKDRTRHMYVIGKTGMGKSTLLENLAIQDIQNGEGFAFIDPHGKSAEFLLDYVPKERVKDILYFAPFDMENPISFNVMEDVGADKRHLVVSGLMSAFKKIWVDAWSARMEYILSNTLLALLEYPGSTLLGINRMLADKIYRKKVVDNIKDPAVKSFWVDEFAKYTERFAAEATPAIQNKVGQFTSNPLIRNIIGQAHSTFDIRKMMDERKIMIINLSKGRVGESNANLLGSMLITKIYLAAMSRADTAETDLKRLPNFYLYVDEFQSFANESFADVLSEARKYKLNLTIAHQYVEQMSEEVRAAVFGNVGTMVSFRVGAFDSELLEKEFAPQFTAEDMVNLGFAQIYLKLMIDGVSSQPFSATTMPPVPKPAVSLKDEILKSSREQFARQRPEVEQGIKEWHEPEKIPDKFLPPKELPKKEAPKLTDNIAPKVQLPAQIKIIDKPAPAQVSHISPVVPPKIADESSQSQNKFKSDLKDLLKSIGQKDVLSGSPESKPIPRPPSFVAEKSRPIATATLAQSPKIDKPAQPLSQNIFRNDNKIPTAENLAGLRAALTAVIKPKDSTPSPISVSSSINEASEKVRKAIPEIIPKIQPVPLSQKNPEVMKVLESDKSSVNISGNPVLKPETPISAKTDQISRDEQKVKRDAPPYDLIKKVLESN